jgi:hypothetical protein
VTVTENDVVLATVQAMLGLVSPDVHGVAVEIDGDSVTLHLAVARADGEIREDINDMVGDLEGLLWPERVEVTPRVHVGSTNGAWEGRQHRVIFLAKGHGVG